MKALRNDQDYEYVGSLSSSGANYTGFSYKARNAMQQNALEVSYALKF
jgi:hypothetical protein